MRLIDADIFLYQLEGQYMEHDLTRKEYIELEDRIMQQPTVEIPKPAEPKTGKWVSEKRRYKSEDGNDYTYFISHCSECGVRRRIGWQGVAFCPNCGAKMKGEDE